jgi:hypothetical protein
MMLKMYSVRDQKAEIFNTPFYKKTHGEAERDFKTLVNDPKSVVAQYPEDYDLWYLGEYCDQTGSFKTLDTPQHVTKAVNVIDRKATPVDLQ